MLGSWKARVLELFLFSVLLSAVGGLPSLKAEIGSQKDIQREVHVAAVPVEVGDIGVVFINVTAADNVTSVAGTFCQAYAIPHPRCAHFVALDLWDALWCAPGQKVAARSLGVEPPPLFRFVHHENHFDSDEFSLLRPRLVSNGYVECASGTGVTGEEDAVWMLGHLPGSLADEDASWFFAPLAARAASRALGECVANTLPGAGHLGNKDDMFHNLVRLGDAHGGDAAVAFIPRTWGPPQLARERAAERGGAGAGVGAAEGPGDRGEELAGLWVQKDPQKELGAGIALVSGGRTGALDGCKECVLQRYVDNPHLLNGKKYNLGVYTAVTSLEPLEVRSRGTGGGLRRCTATTHCHHQLPWDSRGARRSHSMGVG